MKTLFVIVSVSLLLSACNTVQGAGQDIKGAGTWTSDSAQKVKKKIEDSN
jgi:predicted small secreted protein